MIGFYNYTVILTYLSALSAAVGIALAMNGSGLGSMICLLFSGLCDMFDGTVAKTRKRTKAEKRYGIWIDSLADVLAFGMLPAAAGYCFGMKAVYYYVIIALYVLAALIRLAYYGVTEEERQDTTTEARTTYNGLPVTASALIFPLLFCFKSLIGDTWFTPVYAVVLALTALAFVLNIKVHKPAHKELYWMLAIGVVIFAVILVLSLCR